MNDVARERLLRHKRMSFVKIEVVRLQAVGDSNVFLVSFLNACKRGALVFEFQRVQRNRKPLKFTWCSFQLRCTFWVQMQMYRFQFHSCGPGIIRYCNKYLPNELIISLTQSWDNSQAQYHSFLCGNWSQKGHATRKIEHRAKWPQGLIFMYKYLISLCL